MMKFLLCLLLLCPPLSSGEDFYVSWIGTMRGDERGYTREKLIALYDANNISRLAVGAEAVSGRVVGVLRDGLRVRWGETYVFIFTDSNDYNKGSVFSGKCKRAGTHKYKTSLGGTTTSEAYMTLDLVVDDPRLMTREAFVEALRSGEVFNVQLVEYSNCGACMGDGSVRGRPDLYSEQKPDEQYDCKDCSGEGKLPKQVMYSIRWAP